MPDKIAKKITTRFAPSPTGKLHLGHAYAALVAYHLARDTGGEFLLRFEDLDRARSRAEYETAIVEDLQWLGLRWRTAPVRQSERTQHYTHAVSQLENLGLVYPCFCSRKDIADSLSAPHGAAAQIYPGICRRLTQSERTKKLAAAGTDYALRLDVSRAIEVLGQSSMSFMECLHGANAPQRIAISPELVGDFVLMRKGGEAAYNLAVVVDDAAQCVNFVTRGEDLLDATHAQILLQRLLGLPAPIYAHHPLVRDESGKRLAKRSDAQSLDTLRSAGVTPIDVLRLLPPLPDFERLASAFLTSC